MSEKEDSMEQVDLKEDGQQPITLIKLGDVVFDYRLASKVQPILSQIASEIPIALAVNDQKFLSRAEQMVYDSGKKVGLVTPVRFDQLARYDLSNGFFDNNIPVFAEFKTDNANLSNDPTIGLAHLLQTYAKRNIRLVYLSDTQLRDVDPKIVPEPSTNRTHQVATIGALLSQDGEDPLIDTKGRDRAYHIMDPETAEWFRNNSQIFQFLIVDAHSPITLKKMVNGHSTLLDVDGYTCVFRRPTGGASTPYSFDHFERLEDRAREGRRNTNYGRKVDLIGVGD